MVSNEQLFFILLGCILVLGVAMVVLSCRIEKLKRRLDLVDETFKQWKTNFNEFRGMCDVLERNFNATNERVNGMVRCYEDWIPIIETMRSTQEDKNEKRI